MRLTNKQKELIADRILKEESSKLPAVNYLNYDEVQEKLDKLSSKIEKLKEEKRVLVSTLKENLKKVNPDLVGFDGWYSETIPSKKSLNLNGKTNKELILDKIELSCLDSKSLEELIDKIKSTL